MNKNRLLITLVSLMLLESTAPKVIPAEKNNLIPESLLGVLITAGYSIQDIKKNGNEVSASIKSNNEIYNLSLQPCVSTKEAEQKVLSLTGMVSAGLTFLSMEKGRMAILHHQILYAQKGVLFFKIESKIDDQEEALKALYKIMMPALP